VSKRQSTRKSTVNTGRVLRPKPNVLSDRALVPEARLIKPPPNQFTHVVLRAQPYYYGDTHDAADGELAAGTVVVLMVYDSGPYCRVVDAQGLYVETMYEGLRRL
jgi:hypothetical protein